jgi:hypothetical protein
MYAKMTQNQLNNKIENFLDRKSKEFPEMHLTENIPDNLDSRTDGTWFKKPGFDR